jgi:hypothetical protein
LKWDVCITPEGRHRSAPPRCKVPIPTGSPDCDVIVCYGGAKLTDENLASTMHCMDDEIFEWLKQRQL